MNEMSSGDEAPALADVDLVQQCIEGSEEAVGQLKRSLTPFLSKVLSSYGASNDEIDEILAQALGGLPGGSAPALPRLQWSLRAEIVADGHLREPLDIPEAARGAAYSSGPFADH